MAEKKYNVEPGQQFGCFLVESYVLKSTWLCLCVLCGEHSMRRSNVLHTGQNKWCKGCRRDTPRNHEKHKREYRVWAAMKQRCLNKNAPAYENYGGRGISVCKQWIASFEVFLEDMGKCPDNRSLDRKNNDGNYEPSNCRWAASKEQHRNKRNNRQLTYEGRTQTVADWAEELGMTWAALYYRLRRGWSVERALSEPLHEEKRREGDVSS